MATLSPDDFRKLLQAEMNKLAVEHNWNLNQEFGRGYAFQLWCAITYCGYDQEVDIEPEDAMMYGPKDLGADLVFEDSNRKHVIIAQCKYVSLSERKNIDESDVASFINRHAHFSDQVWVRSHASEKAKEALLDYADRISSGWRASYLFFSTGRSTDRIAELVETVNEKYRKDMQPVTCTVYDISGLKDFYIRSQTLEESIPDEVQLQLPRDKWIEKDQPFPTILAIVKGNALRALYQRHKEALFAFNIRGYLGDRGINEAIRTTAEKKPDEFFYFNNGVSAICTDFSIDKKTNLLTAKKFQIINGAQTVGALRQATENPSVEVLLRVTKTLGVATEKGFNAEIILYNNSQNVVKVSDFRANDPIQLWLEKKFAEYKNAFRALLPDLVYVRKRGMKKRGRFTGTGIKLEDAAKIRYAFLNEPTRAIESPKDMWTRKEDGGVYELAFGLDGKEVELWPDSDFEELLLAIAIFWFVEEETKAESKNEDLKSFGRLKYHALSLAGLYFRRDQAELLPKNLLADDSRFKMVCQSFWAEARRTLIDAYFDAINRQKTTIVALARNTEQWDQMKRKFSLYIRAPANNEPRDKPKSSGRKSSSSGKT